LNETESVGEVVSDSLNNLYDQIVGFLPEFLVAILVLVFGWAIAILLGKLVRKILEMIKIDELANRLGFAQLSERAGRKLSISGFGDWLVKWFFMVVAFVAAADILGLHQVGEFLFSSVIPYLADVVIAGAILVIGIVASNFLQDVAMHSLAASGLKNVHTVGTLVRWSILIFAFLAALSQLGVASTFIQDLFRAFVAMLAISGGLAFGLGGREHAKEALDKLTAGMKR